MTTTTPTNQQGWYFYGITRKEPLADALAAADGVQLLDCCGLAAVVKAVTLAEYTPAALQQRLTSEDSLESTVRGHNRVIEAIHEQQAILPAKFGVVYAGTEDVVSAVRPAHDALLQRLDRLEGCDEWAVHLYADCAAVRELLVAEDATLRARREQCAAARPGRAYFLEQQLRLEVQSATEETLLTLAQTVFDRLSRCAVAGQMNPLDSAADPTGEVEILRASFLVSRGGADGFKDEVRACADTSAALRCDFSGPWPPYSFAGQDGEESGE